MSDTYAAFGRGLELGGKFTDRSTYTFELAEPGEAAAASASPVMVRGQATSGPTLRPNVVINRFNKSGRSLSGFVSEQKIKLAEALPIAKLEREGALEVAGGTGHELIFHLVGQRPVPSLAQWHVLIERDDAFDHAVVTTTKDRFDADRPTFFELLDSWK
ncbi:MAG: hypothetical protein ACYS22_22145 [Planctomycetota bacterium]|jgi:hypothetical protein